MNILKMSIPNVSIIITSFNTEQYIVKCLQSAINQTYKNWEIVIVDDYSTDNSIIIINDFLHTLDDNIKNKIKLIKNMTNRGCYVSRNVGIQNSVGKYITILDSDDILQKNKLLIQVRVLERNPYAITVGHLWQRFTENGQYLLPRTGPISLMFRRKVIKDIGYFDSVRYGADTEFSHRLRKYYANTQYKSVEINQILYFALSRDDSLCKKKETGPDCINRKIYSSNFSQWHKNTLPRNLFINFPLTVRPFAVPNDMICL